MHGTLHLFIALRVAKITWCLHKGHGPKSGELLCPFRRELSPYLTRNAAWTEASLPSSILSIQQFGHNRHKQKIRIAVPVWGRAGSPSNTKWPGRRPTSVSSGILIHPTVWPQRTWADNWVRAVPLFGGKLGRHLTQCGLYRGLPPYQVAS